MRISLRIKRIIGLFTVIFLMMFSFNSAALAFGATGDAGSINDKTELDTAPHTKPDGSRFKIAYIDYDEYLPASRQLFYIFAGLEELGWIKEGSIPFTIDDVEQKNMSTRQMYEELCKADLGDFIELSDNGFFYLAYDDEKTIANALKEGAGRNIDMVITFGTSAGVFVKSLGLSIPMIDFNATDPVASGIIDSSTDGSGNPNVWAHVEPSPVFRQLKYYDSISHFKKLGAVIYGDETISGVPDIERASDELGFEFVKYNIDEQPRESKEELDDYYKLVGKKIEQMAGEDIDAFYMTVDLINDLSMIEPLLLPLYDKHIPVYMMDDAQSVKAGGLMLIAANDLQNIGRFIADVIAKVFNGAQAGSLPCIYNSAPSIYVNYRIAKRIGYPLKFEFLAICDEIFS